jgi:cellulose biosynthesis protein BcsQ
MVEQIYEFLTLLIRKGPEFIAVGFLGLVGGVTLTAFGPRWLRRLLSPQVVDSTQRKIAKLEHEVEELTQTADKTRAANADLVRDKETFQLTIATQSGRIEELVTTRDQLSGEAERVKEQLADASLKNKQLYKSYSSYKGAYKQASAQLEAINQTDGKVWLKPVNGTNPPFVPLSARKTAIISLANLKGGVGKTTLTANLGAAFASEGLRVLLIDLDHQSTLSTRSLGSQELDEVIRTKRFIHSVFTEDADLTALNRCVTRVQRPTGDGSLYVAPVHEDFADIENRLMTRWSSGVAPHDVRYLLRRALHSTSLRQHYDVILIDCPPRLTTGSINALAASDYVLIPVLLEEDSAAAVPRMIAWLKRFQSASCADLNILGVVGNRAYPRKNLIARQAVVWKGLEDRCKRAWGSPVHLFPEVIRDHPAIAGPFAALDPRYSTSYKALIDQIRKEIRHAHLEPAAVHQASRSATDGRWSE